MRNRIDVRKSIDDILIPYADCICWEDFGSAGNPCYNPMIFHLLPRKKKQLLR